MRCQDGFEEDQLLITLHEHPHKLYGPLLQISDLPCHFVWVSFLA